MYRLRAFAHDQRVHGQTHRAERLSSSLMDTGARAKDCYQRSQLAKQAAAIVDSEAAREWLLRMSEQWADLARQYQSITAQRPQDACPFGRQGRAADRQS